MTLPPSRPSEAGTPGVGPDRGSGGPGGPGGLNVGNAPGGRGPDRPAERAGARHRPARVLSPAAAGTGHRAPAPAPAPATAPTTTPDGSAPGTGGPSTVVAGRSSSGRRGNALLGAAGLGALVLLLQVLPSTGLVSAEHLPPAIEIGRALATELAEPDFWVALRDTLTSWSIGLAIAVAAGIVAGVVIGSVPPLRALTASTIEFLRPIPSVALIPIAVLLYGNELRSSLLLVVYASFWQVLIQVLHGVQDVDPVAEQTARSYRLGVLARIRYVTWPTALPYVMTGVRLAAAVALVLAITAELVIGSPGLGQRIGIAQSSGAEPLMYALVVVTGILGVLINFGARAVERRLLSWHQSVRGEAIA